jgi:hypothetical protein
MPLHGWLEDRLFALRHAVWANLVRQIVRTITVLEAINRRAAPGVGQRVARKICLKLIPLLQITLKRQDALLYLHLRRLGIDQLVEKLEKELLGRGDVNVLATKKLLQIFARLGGSNDAGGRRAH